MIPLVAVALVAAMLTGPPPPDDDEPDLFGQNWPLYERICDHIVAQEIPYLSRNPEGFAEHCPRLIAPFYLRAEPQHRYRDSLHILFVAACESNFDVDANTRRWGTGTQGLLSFMRHLNWAPRILGRVSAAGWSAYDTMDAANLASIMVYLDVNPKVDAPNFYWWWSCHRGMNRYLPEFGIPQVWYCPKDAAYWARVPPGSNRVCGGRTY